MTVAYVAEGSSGFWSGGCDYDLVAWLGTNATKGKLSPGRRMQVGNPGLHQGVSSIEGAHP